MPEEQRRGVPSPDPDHPEDWMVEPLDYLVLKELPDEGTNVGLYQIGETASGVHKSLGGASLISLGSLVARLRMLRAAGYVRQVRMIGSKGNIAYQKTVRGKEVLESWNPEL